MSKLLSARKKRPAPKDLLPAATDWRTTDEEEVLKRRVRAREESFRISNLDPSEPVFSNFEVRSASGMVYRVEVRDLISRHGSCTCTDFRVNGLGTCKHIEALRLHLARRERAAFKGAERVPSHRIDIVPHAESGRLRVERNARKLPPALRARFDDDGFQLGASTPEELAAELAESRSRHVRLSQDVAVWFEARARERDRVLSRREYELAVRAGRHPEHVTLSPLFPYQREGMLHLAFNERALLADEMGLGKTLQAIAACALLHRLGRVRRVLVVTPASLKSEWEEQIGRFTELPLRLVVGPRAVRSMCYRDADAPFFTIVNYEQVVADTLDINACLRPDVVVLDEAQRIKNWSTKTAQAVKRLDSRYAFVLTGTPIENRIDELRSLVDFLDPALLGPLFRFNREYYALDERGRPAGYRNLDRLRERVRPILLRRRKVDVEHELPDRSDRTLFVALTPAMRSDYESYEHTVHKLASIAKRRPLTPREQDILMVSLNCMRMVCDSPGLIKENPSRECPKLGELARVLDEVLSDDDVKVLVFSEWTGMLERVRTLATKRGVGYAWHTGAVDQRRRRAEIVAFRTDPRCRLFLSTDSGGVGLNLQNASVVINCDLPWNPARLEQRIARAWRKGQRRAVTVVNLVAENTIEHGMLGALAEKSRLAAGLLDGGDLSDVKLKSGRQAFLARLEQVMTRASPTLAGVTSRAPTDPAAAFARRAREALGSKLAHCEETWIPGADAPVILVVLESDAPEHRARVEQEFRAAAWRGAPPVLQVLDSAAWQALGALAAAGMITIHSRATRSLLPEDGRPPLTPEQLARIDEQRAIADKKRRAAAALMAAGLPEEAAPLAKAADEAEAEVRALTTRGCGAAQSADGESEAVS